MTAVESQIVQLRDEMHAGFSALGEVRLEMRAMHYEVLARFERQDKRLDAQDDKFEELKRHMHMLHEDVLERIARLRER